MIVFDWTRHVSTSGVLVLAFSVDVYSHGPSSSLHYSVQVAFNVSVMML